VLVLGTTGTGVGVTAIVTSAAALLSSVFAIYKLSVERNDRLSQFDEERERWKSQFEVERQRWRTQFEEDRERGISEWRVQFLRELVANRQAAYPVVFASLGAVIDIGDPDSQRQMDESPERLLAVASEILGHLYGEAGLLMSMSTRNWLHRVRIESLKWHAGHGDYTKLVNAFFYARRHMRQDIQIADFTTLETALSEISDERRATPRMSGPPDSDLDR
jgi:hypothetical protein